ncbi:relaxase/mobilization nuclease, partial [Erysipelatoclostridium ramosum]|nr:relaxase/mobilization nuclease [Thomasclavelia ramosa]
MDTCHRENLPQVDLLSPSENKIKNREYYASRYGQEKLDKLNEQILADGLTPRKTTFQTQKQYLRDAITEISHTAKDVEDFKKQLYEKYQ